MSPSAISQDGTAIGDTHFERLGQQGVKNTRCFSLTQTHQHPWGLVGPTAGGKVYDYELSENEKIRQETVKVCKIFLVSCVSLTIFSAIDKHSACDGVVAAFCPPQIPLSIGRECRCQQYTQNRCPRKCCLSGCATQYRSSCCILRLFQ